jgi:dGTPase
VDLDGEYEGTVTQRVALRSFGSMLITRYIEALQLEPVGGGKAAVVIDDDAWHQVEALKSLTQGYVVKRPSLAVLQRGQSALISSLWDWYFEATGEGGDVRLLPAAYRARLHDDDTEEGRIRLVTDLIAGMTENTALELYRRMSGVTTGSVLDSAARGST